MKLPDFDDKDLVIMAIFIICMASIIMLPATAKDIILNAFSGLFGIAIGKGLSNGGLK